MRLKKKAVVVFLGIVIILSCIIATTGRSYAMEKTENIKTNAQQYEINIILEDLGIKRWHWPPYALDEMDGIIDEPLGQYTQEELRKYTDRILDVKVFYGQGYLWEGEKENFFQIVKIYENNEMISCSYTVWKQDSVYSGGSITK